MKIHGLLIDVYGNPGRVKEVDIEENDLDSLYEVLGCRCIDIAVRKVGNRTFDFVCDDEGALKENPIASAVAKDGRIMLVGNLFVCNHYKEHLTSLSNEDVSYLREHIWLSAMFKFGADFYLHPVLSDVDYA